MSSRDVYIELLMIFVVSFIILLFLKSIGEQLIFMLIAFVLSTIMGDLFAMGIKGAAKHPLISRGRTFGVAMEKIHEKKYVFLIFFAFIIGSTVLGTVLSTDIVNNVLYPSVGSVQGALIVSAMITLVLYITMLWMFNEPVLNSTTLGLVAILVVLSLLFIFFSGYADTAINYVVGAFSLLRHYATV